MHTVIGPRPIITTGTNITELWIVIGIPASASSVPQTPYRCPATAAKVSDGNVSSDYLNQVSGNQAPDFHESGGEQEDVGKPERSPTGQAFPFYDFAMYEGYPVSVNI